MDAKKCAVVVTFNRKKTASSLLECNKGANL